MKKSIMILLTVIILLGGIIYFTKTVAFPLKYEEYITKYSKEYSVDPYLVSAIIYKESGFYNERLVKYGYSKGEKNGLMQIKDTVADKWAKEIGINNFEGKMLLDPETNIKLGTWYLSQIKKQNDSEEAIIDGWYNRNVIGQEKRSLNDTERYIKSTIKTKKMYKTLYSNKLK